MPETTAIKSLIETSKALSNEIEKDVLGQSLAIKKFVNGYMHSELFATNPNKPRATYLFCGPPGVGKTSLAHKAAEVLNIPFLQFDMSEYAGKNAENALIGFESTYSNSTKGILTSYVEENPKCLLLFDEIEKANASVQKLFLQILEGARLTDKYTTDTVSFKDAILIFTTNAGKEVYEKSYSTSLSELPDSVILDGLREDESFPNELVSRFAAANLVLFNNVDVATLSKLAMVNFRQVAATIKEKHQLQIRYSKELSRLCILNKSDSVDARIISGRSKAMLEEAIKDLLTYEISTYNNHNISKLEICYEYDEHSNAYPFIKLTRKPNVLYITDGDGSDISTEQYNLVKASNEEEMIRAINDIPLDFILIDMFTGLNPENTSFVDTFGIDSKGNICFELLTTKKISLPIYVTEDERFDDEDKLSLVRRGATSLVKDISSDAGKRALKAISDDVHFNKAVRTLSEKNLIVTYKTKFEVSGEVGKIIYYNFALQSTKELKKEEPKQSIKDLLIKYGITPPMVPGIKLENLPGNDNVKKELNYIIQYFKNPDKFKIANQVPDKGVILYGFKECDIEIIAAGLAGTIGANYLSVAAESLAKNGPASLNYLIDVAMNCEPAIVFIKDIEKLSTPGSDSFMKGLKGNLKYISKNGKKVFLMASAANAQRFENSYLDGHSYSLNECFENTIMVDMPSLKDRKTYIYESLKRLKMNLHISGGTVNALAELTGLYNYTDIDNLLNYIVKNTLSIDKDTLTDDYILTFAEQYRGGQKTVLKAKTENESKQTAYHEAGHAFLMYYEGRLPSFITIEPRTYYLGFVSESDYSFGTERTEEDFRGSIRVSLAGRASEIVFFGEDKGINCGASGDLRNASSIAINMVSKLGLTKGNLIVVPKDVVTNSSLLSSELIGKANDILLCELENSKKIIEDNKETIDALAKQLLLKNHLTGEEILKIIAECQK